MTPPEVLNKRIDPIPDDAVYVGRPSKWGNPFHVGTHGTRDEVIDKYREWLEVALKAPSGYLDLDELRGKDLVCWCAPKRCHADVLLTLANQETPP